MIDPTINQKLAASIRKVARWVEDHGYKAYDPGDGNNSFLHFFTFNSIFLERLLQQSVYRAPFNFRPLMGIKPHISTKGMGYMAWGYAKLYKLTGEVQYAERARSALQWLIEHKAPAYNEYCWGNDFLFSTRAGRIPRHEPTIVWSSLIGQAYVEAYESLGDAKYLEVAASTCRWILKLPREKTSTGSCLSYVPYAQSSIHNSNLLGAGLLARVGKLTKIDEAWEVAREAAVYTCTRQNADGAWYYGEAEKNHWIDNFHTGYNLDNLKRYRDATGDHSFDEAILRGFDYFKRTFFEENGRPKYYHNKALPIDIQSAAQAIDTLSFFSGEDADALGLAQKVAGWTIDHMQAPDGHFYYRDLGWAVNKTPMLHWGQGTMFKALAHLLTKLTTPNEAAAQGVEGGGKLEERQLKYVLVTPARNEEAFIENTIRSMVAQTVRPVKWVIVSDGSTDRTDEIVKSYAAKHDWIELARMNEHRDRQFAAKAHCFNAGCAAFKGLDYDVIGNLDADITFEPGYIEFLLKKFAADPRLGVAGTPFSEEVENVGNHTYAHQFANTQHVSGACQLFRAKCFAEVGGYIPIKGGAIDWVAVTTARMKGWQTRTFLEKTSLHHRKLGTGNDSTLMVRFRYGQKAYYVGGHPVWEILRSIFQMRERPYVICGAYFMAGYLYGMFTRMPRPIPPELMNFHRSEQMARLYRLFRRNRSAAA